LRAIGGRKKKEKCRLEKKEASVCRSGGGGHIGGQKLEDYWEMGREFALLARKMAEKERNWKGEQYRRGHSVRPKKKKLS